MFLPILVSALLSIGYAAEEEAVSRPILPVPRDARLTISSKGYHLEGQYYLLPEEKFDSCLEKARLLVPSEEGAAAGHETSLDEARAIVVDAHRSVEKLKGQGSADQALIDDLVADLVTAGNSVDRLSTENKYLKKDVRKTTMMMIAVGAGSAVIIGVESYLLVRLTLL